MGIKPEDIHFHPLCVNCNRDLKKYINDIHGIPFSCIQIEGILHLDPPLTRKEATEKYGLDGGFVGMGM